MSQSVTRLNYFVMEVTSEDKQYPCTELIKPSPEIGFQTERFTNFPFEITLGLKNYVRIETIQIMSHPFKIPTSMNIYLGD